MVAIAATARRASLPALDRGSGRRRDHRRPPRASARLLGAALEHELADPAAGQAQDDVRTCACTTSTCSTQPPPTVAALHARGPQGRLLLQRRLVRELAIRTRTASPPRSRARATGGRVSSGSTSAASTCSCRSWKPRLEPLQAEGLRLGRPRQHRRLHEHHRLPAHGRRPARVQRRRSPTRRTPAGSPSR